WGDQTKTPKAGQVDLDRVREHVHLAIPNEAVAIRSELLDRQVEVSVGDLVVGVNEVGVRQRDCVDRAIGQAASGVKEEGEEDVVVFLSARRDSAVEVNVLSGRLAEGPLVSPFGRRRDKGKGFDF